MRIAIVIAGLLGWTAASAGEEAHVHRAQMPGHNPLDCYCRAQGRIFAPGESICLRTPEGGRMAECRMVTNVMSWSVTGKPCPES
jgi:hypothetical protein